MQKGAYEDETLNAITPLVKNARPYQKKAIDAAMLAGDMDDIINGLNALSRQPFVIDEFIFEAQKWSYDNALDKDSKLNVPKFPTQWNVGQESVMTGALTKKQRCSCDAQRKAKRDSINRAGALYGR